MAITINGDGSITGLSVGGLPDGSVDSDTLASGIEKPSISDSGDATAITIDSSESVGIDNSTGFGTYSGTGVKYSKGDGTFFVGRDGGQPLWLNRETSQGDLIGLAAAGTTYARIGTDGDDLVLKTGTAGNTERLRIDSSGNVGFGTTTPQGIVTVKETNATGINYVVEGAGSAGNTAGIYFTNHGVATPRRKQGIITKKNSSGSTGDYGVGSLHFLVDSNTDDADVVEADSKLEITSGGNVLIGTSNDGGRLEVTDVDNASVPVVGINANSYSSGTVYHIRFRVNDSTKGTVTSNGSSVAYNTSSDHRLKENVDYNWDATARLKQLKPCRFNWIADDTNTLIDGFIAHEVSSIVPEAVSGEKDAMTSEVLYAEGDDIPEGKSVGDVKTASEPDYQGIDQSKLVPLLVKTIQELEARITALEA